MSQLPRYSLRRDGCRRHIRLGEGGGTHLGMDWALGMPVSNMLWLLKHLSILLLGSRSLYAATSRASRFKRFLSAHAWMRARSSSSGSITTQSLSRLRPLMGHCLQPAAAQGHSRARTHYNDGIKHTSK